MFLIFLKASFTVFVIIITFVETLGIISIIISLIIKKEIHSKKCVGVLVNQILKHLQNKAASNITEIFLVLELKCT